MAHRSDREPGHPAECPRRHSLQSRVGPSSRIPSGPAVRRPTAPTGRTEDCTRPTTSDPQITPCNAGAIHRRHSRSLILPLPQTRPHVVRNAIGEAYVFLSQPEIEGEAIPIDDVTTIVAFAPIYF